MIIDITDGFSEERVSHIALGLRLGHPLHMTLTEHLPPKPAHLTLDKTLKPTKQVKRILLASFPLTKEIIVAVEGDGCIFLTPDTNINPFVFIQKGFTIPTAKAMVALFTALATLRDQPQLTHQHRS